MINAGIDLFAVGRILGHADHQSTMRYSHLANDTLLQAVEAGAAKMNVSWATPAGAEPTPNNPPHRAVRHARAAYSSKE